MIEDTAAPEGDRWTISAPTAWDTSGLEVSQMSSQAIQSQVGLHNPERVGAQNPDHAATVNFRLVDFGLLAALIGTIIFFAVQLF